MSHALPSLREEVKHVVTLDAPCPLWVGWHKYSWWNTALTVNACKKFSNNTTKPGKQQETSQKDSAQKCPNLHSFLAGNKLAKNFALCHSIHRQRRSLETGHCSTLSLLSALSEARKPLHYQTGTFFSSLPNHSQVMINTFLYWVWPEIFHYFFCNQKNSNWTSRCIHF